MPYVYAKFENHCLHKDARIHILFDFSVYYVCSIDFVKSALSLLRVREFGNRKDVKLPKSS